MGDQCGEDVADDGREYERGCYQVITRGEGEREQIITISKRAAILTIPCLEHRSSRYRNTRIDEKQRRSGEGVVNWREVLTDTLTAHRLTGKTSGDISTESKREDARALGADEVIVSRNAEEMEAHVNSFDFILDTVAASHNLDAYTNLLKLDGTLVLVGAPEHPHPSPEVMPLIFKRRSIAGSLIGGIAETQEMLDFCAEKGIVADIEMIPIQKIDEAYDRMQQSDVKYRFVIDNASLAALPEN